MPSRARTILVIDDDAAILRLLSRVIEGEGHRVVAIRSAARCARAVREQRPDLVVSDWMLGGRLQGVDLCARLKSSPATRSLPIVIMTGAKVDFRDQLTALSHGADLYLTKDSIVGPGQARFLDFLRSLLRRPSRLGTRRNGRPRGEGLRIDLARHTVRTRHELVTDLSTKLFDLLYLIARRYPREASRRYLVKTLWRNRVREREADVGVSRLKARLERGKDRLIESVVGRGYRLRSAPEIR